MIHLPLILGIGLALSAGTDTVTSRTAFQRPGVHEGNPALRPFVSTTPRLVASQVAGNGGIWWLSSELRRRKTKWWVAPLIGVIAGHSVATFTNRGVH